MTRAKVRNLDAELPAVPAEKPAAKTTPSRRPPSVKMSLAATIIDGAAERLHRTANRLNRSKDVKAFASAAFYRMLSGRLDIIKHGKDPLSELEDLQKTLSLLTWELGQIIEDISSGNTETKEQK